MIYFDNSATTRVRREVLDEMLIHLTEGYGNPSSVYSVARDAKRAVDTAREQVANAIGAGFDEIYFTSGGTEADNWAIKGIAEAYEKKGNHIITSSIEHHAVLHTCEYLQKKGYEVTYLKVDKYGKISLQELEAAIRPTTILISIMFANNEIGTIQPISEIGAIAHKHGVLFHTDAVQAIGNVPIDVKQMNIDLLSLSGHKVYASKGVGALYVKKGVAIRPLLHGGGHERNRRAGTENVPAIAGLGKALSLAVAELPENNAKLLPLRDKIINGILDNIEHCHLNGDPVDRLCGHVNISFDFVEGESILLMLDIKGICASSGSACTSGSLDPSHVLLAIGLPHEKAHGSLRITLNKHNTDEEVDTLLKTLPPIINRLREMSPLYEDYLKQKKYDK